MIRLGIVDFDTSHAVEFTRRINHVGIDQEQWVEGAKVVAGVPGTSLVSPERIGPFTQALKSYGVEILDKPEDLFGKIDAVLIESVDGSVHRERATPFLERGIPTFVDKPFACSLEDARAMVDLASKKHVPIFSSSSLRFAPEVVAAKAKDSHPLGVWTFGPAPTHPRNPGLFHYGIHPVEMLYTLMGQGCKTVTCLSGPTGEVVTGQWSDGRIASVRGIREGKTSYGFTVFGEKDLVTSGVSMAVMYRELLKAVIQMFQTREMPLDPRETLEIVAFIQAARRSAEVGGLPAEISV